VSWMGRISQNRAQVGGAQPLARPQGPKVEANALAETLISDKVLKKHGAHLAPAAGDMQAIAAAVHGLKAHHVTQFSNAVDGFYSALGRSTDSLEPAKREAVIKASMGAMRGLVEALAQHPALMPAMAALTSLLEPRGKLDVAPQAHADAAKAQVLDVVSRFEARLGTSSVLFGFRNLVEGYEARQDGLTAGKRPEVWATITDYLERTVPRPGCEQGQLGTITGLFMQALREAPDDPKKALAVATAAAHAPLADSRAATLQQLDVELPNLQNLPPEAPQRAAVSAIRDALKQVVADNPAGPQELLQAVELVQGKLPHVAAANTPALVQAYQALGHLLATAGTTSAVISVLEHVGQNIPAIITHAGSQAAIMKAAGVQDPEQLAPLLVQAHLARLNRTPEQLKLVEALEKLKRLPPGPALRAAVALLPQIQQAHAGPLAEALFVESRTTDSMDALVQFTTRFSAAFPQLRALADGAGPVAAALARSGTGNVDAKVAQQLAQLVAHTKAALPETPRTKLLERGRSGEPGLIALAHVADFIHNPVPIATELLNAVKEARPNQEAVTEARLALQIAGEVGRFDRVPSKTDLPRITADFKAALMNPKALVAAKGAGPGATQSAAAFAAAHPEFPIEVLFTAARTFDEPRMTWLSKELSSTRSHAYKRLLRDAIFAAAATKHAYLFTVLAQSPADKKAKDGAVTAVAMDHRQGHAADVPWDLLVDGLLAGQDPVARIEAERAAEAMRAIGLDGLEHVDAAGMAALSRGQKPLQALLTFFDKDQYGKPRAYFTEPLMAAVRAQAEGSWPTSKYESEVAKEHLAPLRPEQLAAWRANTATGTDAPAVLPGLDPAQQEALQLLVGVAKTLTEGARVGGKGFEDVRWDAASLERLQGQRDALVGQLRDAQKGSPEHRRLSKALGPVSQRVALLELHAALQAHLGPDAQPPADGQAALAALKPFALAALGPLRKQRADGLVQALDTAAAAVKSAPPANNPRSGNYACDDDSLDAYLTAFGGGCIHPENGFNRGSLVELIAGSQYKMIRAMRDDKPVGRSFLRLMRVELANGYKGMALRMDPPQASSAGTPGNNEKALMYKHALRKAASMGVPLMVSDDLVKPAAQELGLQVVPNHKAKVFIHRGVTGMHHNQGMWGQDYFITWPGITVGQNGPRPPEKDKECARDYTFQIVMPPAANG
jgi:hypothetical protein